MGSELLSVKWSGHQNTFFNVLASARKKKTFCDATIACEGNLYPVHRFVISTCSTYFERILENISDTHPVIVLVDIKAKDIEDLLQYMYTGEVKILQENIDSLFKVGELLKIKGMGVANKNEMPKNQKHSLSDNEEKPEKHQRTDEFDNISRKNKSYRESMSKKETKPLSEDCNENAIQKEIDDSLGPSNQLISEFIAVKEEIFQPNEDSLQFPEHNTKEELRESLMDEDILSAGCNKGPQPHPVRKCHQEGCKKGIRLLQGKHFPACIGLNKKNRPKYRDCHFCTRQTVKSAKLQERKCIPRTQIKCKLCNVALCTTPCFDLYHTVEDFVNYQKQQNALETSQDTFESDELVSQESPADDAMSHQSDDDSNC